MPCEILHTPRDILVFPGCLDLPWLILLVYGSFFQPHHFGEVNTGQSVSTLSPVLYTIVLTSRLRTPSLGLSALPLASSLCILQSPTCLCGVHVESSQSLHRVFMDSTWSPHSPRRVHVESVWSPHGVRVESVWSPRGVHGFWVTMISFGEIYNS
jgi:hypothetical protein